MDGGDVASKLWIIGAESDRAKVRDATRGLGWLVEERDARPERFGRGDVLVACGAELARAEHGDAPLVVAALRTGEGPSELPLSISDYVSLDAVDLRERLTFALARGARRTPAGDEVTLDEVAGAIDALLSVHTADEMPRNLYMSAAYEKLTGRPVADVLRDPTSHLAIVEPEDVHVLYEAFVHRHRPHEYAYRIKHADGQTRWLETRAFPVVRADGKRRSVTITRDVTERERTNAETLALRSLLEGVTGALTTLHAAARSSESLETALSILGRAAGVDRVYIARHDRDGDALHVETVHEWTSEGTERAGESKVVGGRRRALSDARPILARVERGETLSLLRSDLPPSLHPRLDPSGLRSLLAVPIIVEGACWGHLGFVDTRVERRWDAASRSILEATAAAVGSAIQRERAMDSLAEQVHRIRSLFESTAHPASAPAEQLARLLEVGRRLLEIDAALVMHVRPGDVDTCEVAYVAPLDTERQPGDRVPLLHELWKPLVAENRPIAIQDVGTTSLSPDEIRYRSIMLAPLWLHGQIWGAVVFMRRHAEGRPYRDTDLDLARLIASGVAHLIEQMETQEERRKLDASLRETQKLESLGLLAGGIAHDFNNLLMGIIGHATLATRARHDERAALEESLEQITAITRRAASLTRKLLAYAGRDRVNVEAMSLATLVREMSELLSVVLPKDAQLVSELADDLPPVLGDSAQLQQVVMNLITNAGDALAGHPGTIRVRGRGVRAGEVPTTGRFVEDVDATSPYVLLEISDTGVGMDPATLEHLFEPFYTTKGPGRGLGLAAVLGIIRMHHGALDVTSAPGEGTTFRLYLPAAVAPVRAPRPEPPPSSAPLDGVRVLVVDDTAPIRNTIQRVLTMHGATVITACDGVEAVEHVERERETIDVVVLDLTMPRMSGARAHTRIREIVPGLPILLMSGYADGDQVERVLAEPRTQFLAKPFEAAALLTNLRALLDGRNAS